MNFKDRNSEAHTKKQCNPILENQRQMLSRRAAEQSGSHPRAPECPRVPCFSPKDSRNGAAGTGEVLKGKTVPLT